MCGKEAIVEAKITYMLMKGQIVFSLASSLSDTFTTATLNSTNEIEDPESGNTCDKERDDSNDCLRTQRHVGPRNVVFKFQARHIKTWM